jgi:iron complex outermembrane receptor protein
VEYLVGAFYNRLHADQTQVQWGPLGTSPLIVNGQVIGNLYANTGANDPITGSCWAMR